MSTRRFSARQRAALYLAADGRCTSCGCELEPGWHADHVDPWARGGETDVTNGQALCPTCNLKKGIQVEQLREWQQQAREQYFQDNKRDWLLSATPGAGKTRFALSLARDLLDEHTTRRIAVVVPTDALRQQWADAAASVGLSLMPVANAEDYEKRGYDGFVATYAQMANGVGPELARRASRIPTIAILDEIHHAGDNRAWGDGLRHAFEDAVKRLSLTGTPWRQDPHSPIPFVEYGDDGVVHVDYPYEYGRAAADGVCRPIEFHAYDGEARWIDCGTVVTGKLGADLDDDDVGAVLDGVLHPSHPWMPALLQQAAAALDELRADVRDAGGLVVAHDIWRARAYAEILHRLTGEEPVVALSDDADAKASIDRFRNGRQRWIVAVRMVSEGVDIPRLAVGVYAAKTRTPLFFRQVVGRLVRVRPGEEFNARLFIPAIPKLMRLAHEIEEELRHQLERETERDEKARADAESQQQRFELREVVDASEAVFTGAIYKGDGVTPEEVAKGEDFCRRNGIPSTFAVNIARGLREQGAPVANVTVTPKPAAEPRHRRERMLRGEIDRLAGKVAYRAETEKRDVNARLLEVGFPPRGRAAIEQLEQIRDYLVRWLESLT